LLDEILAPTANSQEFYFFFALVQFVEILICCEFRIKNEHFGRRTAPFFPEVYKIA
jgi:hypothetical protein